MKKHLEYDATAEKCPVPLVQTKLLIRQLESGQALKVLLTDPGSIQDIPKFLTMKGIRFELNKYRQNIVELTLWGN
ncbi:sulfurtransferase TusA family protein [Thalassomonas sp. M1454]|uniref:sulfurtransferase TusA family protein n=1 Tax=Thalassomonas sp. M1454 TaxID=2594477 RepID=UPI00117ECEDB|nr:sulfurtransferase TusA family protein [Thalassomonas sp. M1454]TRX56990.1 sulfurtransferase TusA family protein [Thalassomonas sp. M1454]